MRLNYRIDNWIEQRVVKKNDVKYFRGRLKWSSKPRNSFFFVYNLNTSLYVSRNKDFRLVFFLFSLTEAQRIGMKKNKRWGGSNEIWSRALRYRLMTSVISTSPETVCSVTFADTEIGDGILPRSPEVVRET